jgi:hypothetical protein
VSTTAATSPSACLAVLKIAQLLVRAVAISSSADIEIFIREDRYMLGSFVTFETMGRARDLELSSYGKSVADIP